MEKNAKNRTVLIILGILISSSLLFNYQFNYENITNKFDEKSNATLETSDPTQYQLEWYQLWVGAGSQAAFDVAIDSYGYLYQAASTDVGPFGMIDGILVKYDSSGTQIWNRTWGSPNNDGSYGVAVDSYDYVYVVGTVDFHLVNHEEKIILLKYDSLGTYLWNRTWNDIPQVEGRSIVIDSEDSIYITGRAGGSGNCNITIIKYNSTGTKLWQRLWGGTDFEARYGLDLAVDSQDNLYVGAQTNSFGAGSSDAVIIKYDSSGNQIWNQTWGGVDIDGAEAIGVDAENNIYIGGYTDSFGTGTRNMFLAKFDNLGVHLWNKTWSGNLGANCKDLTIDPFGNIYISGETFDGFDAYITFVKYDKHGSLLLYKTWGPPFCMFSVGRGIAMDSLYNVYITGSVDYYDVISFPVVLLKYSEVLPPEPQITISSPDYNQLFRDVAPDFNITIQHHYLLDSIWYTIDGGLTNYSASGSITSWIEGDFYYSELTGTIDQAAWNAMPNDYIHIKFYAEDVADSIGVEEQTIIKETIKLIHLDIVHHSYSSDEFEFIFFIYNETGNGIDFATIQMWWDGTDVSGSVLNLGGGTYIVSLEPITVSPTEDPILLNMTIYALGYDDKYYEAYFAVDPEVIDKTIPDGPNGIPGYNLFYIFGILSVLVAILLRKRIKKL